MPTDSPPHNALERIEPLLERLDLDACLRTLKQDWAVSPIDDGNGSERTQTLYVYSRPEYAVAQAIADGTAPEAALKKWQTAIDKMLAEFQPKRRHSLLVEAVSALRHADSKDPGQAINRFPDDDQDTAACVGRISPIHLALATLTVYQTRDIEDLLGELAAITAPLPGWDKPPQLDLKRIQEGLKVSHQAHESLQEENELLLLQLHQTQEELEQYYLRNLEQEGKTTGHQPKKETPFVKQYQPEKETPSVKHLARRVQLIENSTSWRLTAPLRLFSRILSQKGDSTPPPHVPAPEEKRIRYLQRRIEQLETSSSWKVTAPLRAIGLILKGRTENAGTLFARSRHNFALDEAHKKIKTLKRELAEESHSRRKIAQLADERARQFTQESENRRRAEQLADKRNRQLTQESENRRKAEQLADERSRQVAELKQQVHRGQQELAELQARQSLLQEELVRAEGQIDLIRDLVLKEESH